MSKLITSSIDGFVLSIEVKPGDRVEEGTVVAILTDQLRSGPFPGGMEFSVEADEGGVVDAIFHLDHEPVTEGAPLMRLS